MRVLALVLGAVLLACIWSGLQDVIEAQRGPGGRGPGGRGPGGQGPGGQGPGGPGPGGQGGNWGRDAAKAVLPPLVIEDVKSEGAYAMADMFAASSDQPRIGVTDDYCYRLAGYQPDGHSLKFAFYDFKTQQMRALNVRLPKDCPPFESTPRMAYDSGQWCVISHQALTLLVEPKSGKVKMAAGLDRTVPLVEPRRPADPRRDWEDRDRPPFPAASYRVHGAAGGKYALSVLTKYDTAQKVFTGTDAVLHSAEGRSVTLKWGHAQFGVPPRDRDGVFAVVGSEVIVLTTRPRSPGAFVGPCEIACLVFDAAKGDLKEAQVSPIEWAGNVASRFTLSPGGGFLCVHPMDSINRTVIRRGTWELVFRTEYHDACVGFAPESEIGVFLANKTPQHASIAATDLATGTRLWSTSIPHDDAMGEGKDEPFYAVGAGARTIAARFGVVRGEKDPPEVILGPKAVEFVPLSMAYDGAGRRVAVITLDRVLVLDAKSREEVLSVPLEKPLPRSALAEFIAFNAKGDTIMACVRNQGVWLVDVAKAAITTTLPPVKGEWARPMPDFSGVVYSQSKSEGGNVMLQPMSGEEPTRIFRCGYKDSVAVCLWIGERGNEFLVTEREVGESSLQLIDDRGRELVKYDVADIDPMYVGDSCVTAFVTRKREAVLINEVNRWGYTGVNCTVVSSTPGAAVSKNFSAIFRSEDLPGRSTYGTTAAAPFFGLQHWGDDQQCAFACPAGVLSVNIIKMEIKLFAWNRKPRGFTAVNPKQKEFFVAGTEGLTTYKFK